MAIGKDERGIYNLAVDHVEVTNKRIIAIFENSKERVEAKILKLRTDSLKNGVVAPVTEKRLFDLYKDINAELAILRSQTGSAVFEGYSANLKNTYYLSTYAYEKEVNTQLGLSNDYYLRSPGINTDSVRASFDERVSGLTFKDRTLKNQQAMRYDLQNAIAQNITEGATVKDLSKNIELIGDAYNTTLSRATTISRTELLRAYSIGQDGARVEAENAGVEFNFKWKSTLDSRVRPDHAKADQQEALIINGDPVFTVGGIKFTSPRLPVVSTGSKQEAREVINCRCRRQNQPFGIKPTKRVAKKEDGTWTEVNGDLTAVEWVKKEYGITLK